MKSHRFLSLAGVALLAAGAHAQVGSSLPKVELEGFTQTGAESWEDYAGRAVLIEFFAYW